MNSFSFTDGNPITLADVLANRDRRFLTQQRLNEQYRLPLISLTMIVPGNIKNSSGSRLLFSFAKAAIIDISHQHKWKIVDEVFNTSECGSEQIWVVDDNAHIIKQVCVSIEEQHPLGRFWDIDVFTPEMLSLSRTGIPRKCLLCDSDAHSCTHSRRHPLYQLLEYIQNCVSDFCNIEKM